MQLRAVILFALVFSAVTWVEAATFDKPAAITNNEGVKKLNRHDFVGAITLFEKALQRDPEYSFALDNLAIALNRYALTLPVSRAAGFFRKSLELQPENATTKQNLEAALRRLKAGSLKEAPTDEDCLLLKAVPVKQGSTEAERDLAVYRENMQRQIRDRWSLPKKF